MQEYYDTENADILGRIYQRYRLPMMRWSYRHWGINHDDFPDIYQGLWLRIIPYLQRQSYDPSKGTMLSTYLFVCLKGYLHDIYRKDNLKHQLLLSPMPEQCVSPAPSPLQILTRKEFEENTTAIALRACQDDLDHGLQSMRLNGYSYEECCEQFNITIQLVKTRLFRIRQRASNERRHYYPWSTDATIRTLRVTFK